MDKLRIYLIVVLVVFGLGCKKNEVAPDSTFRLTNQENGFEYEVSVRKLNAELPGTKHVIFVLDPDDLIPILLEEFSASGSNLPLVVVGIHSKDKANRVRDYTPTEIEGESSGKASAYFTFLKTQVIPELHGREVMDATSLTTLVGHSISGVGTCYALTNFSEVFDHYMALSPALFWDDFKFFEIEATGRELNRDIEKEVFLGVGENEDFGITNGYAELVNILESHYPNIRVRHMKVKGSHLGSRHRLIEEGLKWILK